MYISSVAPSGISRSKVILVETEVNLTYGILSVAILLLLVLRGVVLSTLHPLLLALVIIALTAIIGSLLSNIISIWMILALMLIFLGGMMVIFIYITTLAREDKLISTPPTLLFITALVVAVTLSFTKSLPVSHVDLRTLYTVRRGSTVIFLTWYLLLTLFAVVKIRQSHKGALTNWR